MSIIVSVRQQDRITFERRGVYMMKKNINLKQVFVLFTMVFVLNCTQEVLAAVSITFTNTPTEISPEEILDISFDYLKTGDVEEKRLVFICEMRQMGSDNTLVKVIDDNGGSGYSDSSGTVLCNITVPSDASGEVYFSANAVPWSMNREIVAMYESYPTDGTYDYLWYGGSYGVSQDIYYLGVLIAPTDASNTTYCSGITFETYVLASEIYNSSYSHTYIGNILSSNEMENFRKRWYGVGWETYDPEKKLSAKAIPEWGLGEEITDFEDVQKGDSVQIWRSISGSGHSVIFVEWVRDGVTQEIEGFTYWSSQGSTDGIGYNTEYFGDTYGEVDPDQFWVARMKKPRDEADYGWALGEADTSLNPTGIVNANILWLEY